MRAIDADTLVNQCKEYSELLKFDGSTDREWATVKRIIHMLNDAPTIKPEQQIIHCKDCKYSDTDNTLGVMFCWRISYHEADEDGFCSWAERKDAE